MLLTVLKARKNLDESCGYCAISSLSIIRRTKIFLISLVWNSCFVTEDLVFFLSSVSLLQKQVLKNINVCFTGYIPYLFCLPIYAGLNISATLKSVAITSFKDPI